MKASRKLIPAILMLVIATVLMSTASYAWFSTNTTVSATGMNVKAQAASSLVIGNATANLISEAKSSVTTTDSSQKTLVPVTSNATGATGYATTKSVSDVTGLQYTTTPVEASTGLPATGTVALTDVEGATAAAGVYFVDYTYYIAAAGNQDLSNQDLKATIAFSDSSVIYNALSVDFYVMDGNAASPAQKWAARANLKNNKTGTGTAVTLLSDATIKAAATDAAISTKYITVIARVYIDGALNDTENTTYVRNTNAVEVGGTLTVTFTTSVHA